MISPHQMVRRGLARGVRRVGRVRCLLVEGCVFRPQGTVYLVGRYMMKTMRRHALSIDPQGFRRFQQRVCSHDIGAYEVFGTWYGPVDMRLRRKMHDRVDMVLLEQRAYRGLVADIALHENVARIVLQAGEVLDIAGIGQRVEYHHPPFARVRQPVAHEIGADKAGSAGNEYVTGFEAHPAWSLNCVANAVPGP